MSKQTIYFDSNMLIGYFDETDKEMRRIARENINQAKRMVQSREIFVIIPSIVLAEFVEWCIKQEKDVLTRFIEVIKMLDADFPSPSKEHYRLTASLLDEEYLTPHDALIAAHAILDPHTTWLITTDKDLITSRAIKRRKEEMGRKFKISQSFRR